MSPGKPPIIAAAALCFMEQGFHATSIDDIARRLGATKGRVYHHYPSKIDLFFAIHAEGMARLFAAVQPVAATAGGSGLDVLRAMLKAHAATVLENHAIESVAAQGVQMHRFGATTPDQRRTLDEIVRSRDAFEQLFKSQVAAAQADGSMASLDVAVTVKCMLGAVQWSLVWYRPELDADPAAKERLADQMVAAILGATRAT